MLKKIHDKALACWLSYKNEGRAGLYSIQYLRALAATLVILAHGFAEVAKAGNGDIAARFKFGTAGVDIFFIISGFLMVWITHARPVSMGQFLKSRLIRIVPPYWLVTLLMGLLVFFIPQVFNSSQFDWPHFFLSFLFVATEHPKLHEPWPIFFPGWTLNYEMFFYAVFSCALVLGVYKRVMAAAAILVLLIAAGSLMQPVHSTFVFYTSPIMLEFVWGMLLALVYLKRAALPVLLSAALVVLSLCFMFWASYNLEVTRYTFNRALAFGLPAMAVVAGMLYWERAGRLPASPVLKLMGDASYATYLVHPFIIGAIGVVWKYLHLNAAFHDAFIVLACLLASWLGGIVFYFTVERTMLAYLRKKV